MSYLRSGINNTFDKISSKAKEKNLKEKIIIYSVIEFCSQFCSKILEFSKTLKNSFLFLVFNDFWEVFTQYFVWRSKKS